jgi:hypothetical protein
MRHLITVCQILRKMLRPQVKTHSHTEIMG